MNGSAPRVVIFSDLDGTLLDHQTYSSDPADRAIARLIAEEVPLVLCSSKTRAEIEAIRSRLGVGHPFIVENGGALFIPAGYFPFAVEAARCETGYHVVELGLRYRQVVARPSRGRAARLGVAVVGFPRLDERGGRGARDRAPAGTGVATAKDPGVR